MDATTLAHKMLDWQQAKVALDELTEEIKAEVLAIGKTQTVGSTRASYSAGRRKYDYQGAADVCPHVTEITISLFTTIIPQTEKVSWRNVCLHAGIEDIPFTQSPPSVTLKLLE